MKRLHLYFVLQVCVLVGSQTTFLDSPENRQLLRQLRTFFLRAFGNMGSERSFSSTRNIKIQDEVPPNVPFPCNVTGGRSTEVPESVHRLRPGDIDVIAAMGDSLTAGAGVFSNNLLETVVENRGAAATIGGQGTWRTFLTLPNMIKEFNPNLIGYSFGNSLHFHEASQLNAAEIGAMSEDMPFMAKYLVNKIKSNPRIDVKKHWKLITLMIGSNNFCMQLCSMPSPWSLLKAHEEDMVRTLRILRDNLPRTFVALIPPPHLKALVDTRNGRNFIDCYFTTTIECPCLFGLQYRDRLQEYYEIMRRWQELDEQIAEYSEFHTKDFTVEAELALKHAFIPLARDGFADLSYLAGDCFHISQKTNALYANIVWNNLLEPYGNKSKAWTPPYERILCPTPERPFLMTRQNSWKNNKLR
ncbi:phospholipase B1, membrane-associated-like isoform X1 [Hylaeus anthracinus]|uniref:phospholipase B1, membrane-associated-like isoform X1 n=2 Tax=Hylaeus anthracinus TaxID=313031 RepID=UPI0023B9037B|nr:phospholipase B1, membrane-associated-like isoform X1 [Hylaeus anthracinus]